MLRRLPIIATVVVLAALAFLAARPIRWEVEGLSMGPGLLPGDVVASGPLPLLDRWRPPRRFERWILRSPDGATALKRVAGLPGERVEVVDGDLVADGTRLLTPPDVLAGVATIVPATLERQDDGEVLLHIGGPVLDEAEFAESERRQLLPVRDIGLVAVVKAQSSASATGGRTIMVWVGDRLLTCRLTRAGRFAIVAGRLDGRLVAAAWPVADGHTADPVAWFPPGAPAAWTVADVWTDAPAADVQPRLGIRLRPKGVSAEDLTIEKLLVWRDALHRPAADGVTAWQLGPSEVFVLGDFPSGSRDSRQWGPIERSDLLHRVTPRRP